MLRWYVDDSELNAGFGAEIPDMFISGGFIVAAADETVIREAVERAKKKYAESADYPVKWNLKDLEKEFARRDQTPLYKTLLPKSKELRIELFLEMAALPIQIVLSCILGHSKLRSILKIHKEDLSAHAFTNGLMRFALEVRDRGEATGAEVVMDWPAKGNPKPYDTEYRSAYEKGVTTEGVNYMSGPLRPYLFSDAVLYANETSSQLLQLADLLVGAFRDFLRNALSGGEDTFGSDALLLVASKIRGAPKKIVGRGISVSPAGQVKEKIEAAAKSKLQAAG